jgi:hypothetical protein
MILDNIRVAGNSTERGDDAWLRGRGRTGERPAVQIPCGLRTAAAVRGKHLILRKK